MQMKFIAFFATVIISFTTAWIPIATKRGGETKFIMLSSVFFGNLLILLGNEVSLVRSSRGRLPLKLSDISEKLVFDTKCMSSH